MKNLDRKTVMAAVDAPRAKQRPRRAQSETSISLRVSMPMLDLITTAAAVVGKSRTEFMLESARLQAVDVLLDQRFFQLSTEQFEAFTSVLDNPPPPNEKLRQLLSKKAPWEA